MVLRSVSATGGRAAQPLMPVMHTKGKGHAPTRTDKGPSTTASDGIEYD